MRKLCNPTMKENYNNDNNLQKYAFLIWKNNISKNIYLQKNIFVSIKINTKYLF